LQQLAERVRGGIRIAHQEAPRRAELRVDVAAGLTPFSRRLVISASMPSAAFGS
jgi:hypothetical protein